MNEKILKFINKFASRAGSKEVKSFEDLTSEEKDTYREWEVALAGRKLTDDDVQAFLNTELDAAVTRLTDVDLKVEDAVFRKVEVRLIKKIINFLNMPTVEKALLEKQLEK